MAKKNGFNWKTIYILLPILFLVLILTSRLTFNTTNLKKDDAENYSLSKDLGVRFKLNEELKRQGLTYSAKVKSGTGFFASSGHWIEVDISTKKLTELGSDCGADGVTPALGTIARLDDPSFGVSHSNPYEKRFDKFVLIYMGPQTACTSNYPQLEKLTKSIDFLSVFQTAEEYK